MRTEIEQAGTPPTPTINIDPFAPVRNLLGHAASLLALLGAFLPFANWYYTSEPPAGFDFLHMVAYISYLREHLAFPISMWKYTWFAGVPYSQDNPMLHMYLALPLANLLGDVRGGQVYLLIIMFLMAAFSYLSFYEISKRKLLSAALASAAFWSPAVLLNLTRDGWATFSATMMFMPLTLWLLLRFNNKRGAWRLLLAGIFSGLAFWGHTGAAVVMFPFLCLMLLFRPVQPEVSGNFGRFRALIFFAIMTLAVGALPISGSIGNALVGVSSHTALAQVTYPDAPVNMVMRTHPFIWLLAAIAAVFAIKQRLGIFSRAAVPFWAAFVGLFVLQVSYMIGRNPLEVLGHPGRTWWMMPLIAGCLVSALAESRKERDLQANQVQVKMAVMWALPLLLIATASLPTMGFIDQMTMRMSANVSDAFLKGKTDEIKASVPAWMNTNILDSRAWIGGDYTAIWWNIFFPIPEARGYFHPIFTLDLSFWRESAIRASVLGQPSPDIKWSEPLARNYALFLMDWYAIRYVADEKPLAKAFVDSGLVERQEKTSLNYFAEMAKKPTILEATNAPAILVIGKKTAYDTVLRDFALAGLDSQRYVPVRGPEKLSDVSDDDLKNFDGVILYGYDFSNDASDLTRLNRFVTEGGNLLIEAPSAAGDLSTAFPDPLPMTTATDASPRDDWQFSSPDATLFKGVDLNAFGPPKYGDGGWGVKLAKEDSLKPWARVLLAQGGKPIIVGGSLGRGKVLWSGMNLFYHTQQFGNLEEGKLVTNILEYLTPSNAAKPEFQGKRLSPEKAEVDGKDFKGVIFKENFYSGWTAQATASQGTTSLEVFRAGPDLMYVRMPADAIGKVKVDFSFGGPPGDWLLFFMGPLFIFLGLDIAVFNGRLFFGRLSGFLSNRLGSTTGTLRRYWNEEDEEGDEED